MIFPIHPGEILKNEFMEPLGLSANKLAAALKVPTNRLTGIVGGDRSITADTALRLSDAFGTTPEFWVGLQNHYNLEVARQKKRPKIERISAAA
ncbi:HigA family addiction module antitoxin [Varunaivibrio sulfuroxidans]|uniref:Addiction module HigA family antidote n=1 Tax=Varunaivibrio sulfuroxidans TaxID=1773489 RepID=A0A4R3J2D0_9PROT|nr:HigA family addiction module antitoxin [Varunaivibrio sulfuroxidans]TCS59959.1 addiction module HigA family antidote [Varunaivibrio sulfuroxidans]WES31757.1 HigA family addiction module antitoxin [Varunaivibrio sulfuroxidans]